jgi:hypothetical protein
MKQWTKTELYYLIRNKKQPPREVMIVVTTMGTMHVKV